MNQSLCDHEVVIIKRNNNYYPGIIIILIIINLSDASKRLYYNSARVD